MVFYIIAYLDNKTKTEVASGARVRAKFPNVRPGDQNELFDINVSR
jgi:hypothetical protein